MRRGVLVAACLLAAIPLAAVQHLAFESHAYSRACPVNYDRNFVFSPLSFEFDCALVGESLDTIGRAGVAETLGVYVDFAGVYRPILEHYAAVSNGFSFASARAFALPAMRHSIPAFRAILQREYNVATGYRMPTRGLEAWLRATCDGQMDDFKLPVDSSSIPQFAFYDLVSVRLAWAEPFPTENTRPLPFVRTEGGSVTLSFMSDIRLADSWANDDYTLLRLPLKGNASFYAFLPKGAHTLAEPRADFLPHELPTLLANVKSITATGSWHGPTAVVLPKFSLTTSVNLMPACGYFKVPLKGCTKIAGELTADRVEQHARIVLAEQGPGERPLLAKPPEDVIARTPDTRVLVFNRPFLFFVLDEETQTLPVAGQFTGID